MNHMNDNFKTEKYRAYKRMLGGAIVGFTVVGGLVAFWLWRTGWFQNVPMFTPPPILVIMLLGSLGSVCGALISLFSRKWNKF